MRGVVEQDSGRDRAIRMFRVLTFALTRLGRGPWSKEALAGVLGEIGAVIDVQRVNLFELSKVDDTTTKATLVHEWQDGEIEPRMYPESESSFTFEQNGLHGFLQQLEKGDAFVLDWKKDIPEGVRARSSEIKTLAVVPIELNGYKWGFLSCEELKIERSWTHEELESLLAVASTLAYCIDLNRSKEALRRSEEKLRGVLEHVPLGIYWKNKDLKYEGCNQKYASWLGYANPSHIVGKTDRDLEGLKNGADFVSQIDWRVMKKDRAESGNLMALQLEGKPACYLQSSKIPLHDSYHEVVGVLGTVEDITENMFSRPTSDNERRLMFATHNSEVGVFEADIRAGTLLCSDMVLAILGVDQCCVPVRGHPIKTSIGVDLSTVAKRVGRGHKWMLRRIVAKVLTGQKRVIEELPIEQNDGSISWVELRGQVAEDSSPRSLRLVGCIVDITERRINEELVNEENRQLVRELKRQSSEREAFDDMLHMVAAEFPGILFQSYVRDDGAAGILYAGPGLFYDNYIAPNDSDMSYLVHLGVIPDDEAMDKVKSVWNRTAYIDKISGSVEDPCVDIDFPILSHESCVDINNETRCLRSVCRAKRMEDEFRFSGVLVDITEKNRAEYFRRRSEAQFRAVSEALPLGLFLHNNGKVIYSNPAFLQLVGKEDTSDRDCVLSFLPESQRAALKQALLDVQRAPWKQNVVVSTGGDELDSKEWYRFTLAAVREEGPAGSHISGVAGLVENITNDQKLLERDAIALRKAQALHRMKAAFMSMVSHEFRTPLTAIDMANQHLETVAGYFELGLEQKCEALENISGSKFRRSVTRIRRALATLTKLMEDISFYARSESGQHKVSFEPTVVDRVVGDILEELNATTSKDRLRVECQESLIGRQYSLDQHLLRTALANLLSNALKYSIDDVLVKLTEESNGKLVIKVRDTGIGVFSDEIDNLTQPFFRGSNAHVPGSGLGLTIARRAVEAMNGRLVLVSSRGQGTDASLEFFG